MQALCSREDTHPVSLEPRTRSTQVLHLILYLDENCNEHSSETISCFDVADNRLLSRLCLATTVFFPQVGESQISIASLSSPRTKVPSLRRVIV